MLIAMYLSLNLNANLNRWCSPDLQLSLTFQVRLPHAQLLVKPRALHPPSLPAPLNPSLIHKIIPNLLRHPLAHDQKRLGEGMGMVESR